MFVLVLFGQLLSHLYGIRGVHPGHRLDRLTSGSYNTCSEIPVKDSFSISLFYYNVFIFLSGLLFMAKTPAAAAALTSHFERRRGNRADFC
jgi:hypothetical protein